jgi:hypothetical protein
MKTTTRELHQLPNYRKITVVHHGFNAKGDGPFMKFIDDYVPHDERIKTKIWHADNMVNESMQEEAARKLTEAGFKIVGKCTGKNGYSFLCDNWGDEFAEIKNIK